MLVESDQGSRTWELAAEAPVQIMVNGSPFTVLMATPNDLDELALGLLVSEQILTHADAVERIVLESWLGEMQVSVHVEPSGLRKERLGARTLMANTGCGLCGIESLAQLHSRTARLPGEVVPVSDAALQRAFKALPEHQPLNTLTRSVHAAAWCDMSGTILLVREDVGRHNALDKLVGAMARSDLLHELGFIVMSSRCSYELIYKASATNAQLLATISAPTTMALQWSTMLGLPLVSTQRRGDEIGVVRFAPYLPQDLE